MKSLLCELGFHKWILIKMDLVIYKGKSIKTMIYKCERKDCIERKLSQLTNKDAEGSNRIIYTWSIEDGYKYGDNKKWKN